MSPANSRVEVHLGLATGVLVKPMVTVCRDHFQLIMRDLRDNPANRFRRELVYGPEPV